MKHQKLTKMSILSGLAALSLMTLAQSAHAIPPPDYIVKCKSNSAYQMHHWNMLYGGPQNVYYKSVTVPPNNSAGLQMITFMEYMKACPRRITDSVYAKPYERVRKLEDVNVLILDTKAAKPPPRIIRERPKPRQQRR